MILMSFVVLFFFIVPPNRSRSPPYHRIVMRSDCRRSLEQKRDF